MEIAHTKTVLNLKDNRFELKLDDDFALINFTIGKSGDVYLTHTEVPKMYEGKGVAHKLVRESIEIAENENWLIVPICPFVRDFVKSNMEDYKNILSPKTKM